jgi:phosphinothricin acetyltransferase
MTIRDAAAGDLAAINTIYNAEVEGSIATLDTVPMTAERRRAWLDEHEPVRRPALVAEVAGAVAGWACLSDWSARCGYARAAEVSVYVHADHRGRGVGKALLAALIERARAAGLGVLLARIAGPPDGASMALHRAAGFRHLTTMERVGEKFGQIIDVQLLDLQL